MAGLMECGTGERTLTRGDIVARGLREYAVVKVGRSPKWEGERIYWLRGCLNVVIGPYSYEDIRQAGYWPKD